MSDGSEIVRASDEHAAGTLPASVGLGRRRGGRTASSPHSHKFRTATGVLAGLAIGAIAVALVILSGGSSSGPAPKWSDWAPLDGGAQGAREIADHVAPFYRISPVDQLAVVTVVNVSGASTSSGQTTPTSGLQVAVRPDPKSSAVSLLSGNTIAYNLCGIGGSNCSIGVGQPSTARLLLLKREALELALYTFKYIGGTQNVVAILPPGRTAPQTSTGTLSRKPPVSIASSASKPIDVALLFLHDELTPWLQQPLANTLPEQFPPTVAAMPNALEAGLVAQITARGLFSENLVQAQDGSNLIVLDQLPPQ
jgi:hypothetical protein